MIDSLIHSFIPLHFMTHSQLEAHHSPPALGSPLADKDDSPDESNPIGPTGPDMTSNPIGLKISGLSKYARRVSVSNPTGS